MAARSGCLGKSRYADRARDRAWDRQSRLHRDPGRSALSGAAEPGAAGRARLAFISRLALLASIAWIIGLTRPVFDLFGHAVSWRDIMLIGGGFFLLYKGTREIHHRIEDDDPGDSGPRERSSFGGVVAQIVVLDIVFSLDSVITAVGMANEFWVMAAAITMAVAIMLAASTPLAAFVERYPTVKMLALSFLLLIGMTLIADGAGFHVPKGYIYGAIGFSVCVEALNQLVARRRRSRRGSRFS